MFEPNQAPGYAPKEPHLPPHIVVPSAKLPERALAAKWPPDDDDIGSGGPGFPGAGGGGGGGYGDGDFKKGRFKPVAIGIGVLLAIGAAGLLAIGLKSDSEKLSKEQVAQEQKQLQLLPKAEQLPKWREWAKRDDVPRLQQEAFAQLAWAKDAEGLKLIIAGLSSTDHRVRGMAAQALLEYGSPDADVAKPALLKALAEADASDKPQIAWALAVLGEGSAFDTIVAEYRLGHLSKVQRLDDSPAFDPEIIASLVSLEKLASMAGDESEAVRQLVATVLSRTGDEKYTDTLIKLVSDSSIEVAREAAVGLGKIANEKATAPLLAALEKADKDSRQKFLEALRDGIGGRGLILALKSVQKTSAEREKFQTKQLFDMLRELQDPRAADALAAYIESNPKPHWKTEAALRLAEIGDVRAVPTLAWRMRQDPLKLYNQVDEPELRMDDNERVVASRMLADLAILHADKRAQIRAQAEESVLFWVTDKPQPHANGLRFLAAADSVDARPLLRKWSDPSEPLPKEGQQEFPPSWATAQSALRYLGWTKDPQAWAILEKQLHRRPAKVDTTMDSLMSGGLAVLGMTLRAIGVGAAHGLAQWGDPKAYPTLVRYIEEPMNNEQSRLEACFSLAWVATDEQMKEVVRKVHDYNKPDAKSSIVRSCYLETLIRRPVPEATAGLVDLLDPNVDLDVRHQAARAIGFGGITRNMVPQIYAKLSDVNLRADAALALLIGADADTAARAIASYNDARPEELEELKDIYNRTFGYWSDRNYENGDVARWIENAQAVSRVRVRDNLQDWAKMLLSRALQGIEYDNGPHSITRVQFRVRLLNDAKNGNDVKRAEAISILKFMKEKGVLMALKSEPAPLGEMARRAFFEVMNPKIVVDTLPEALPQAGGAAPGVPGNLPR
jgi:HEAT repeat protein